MPKNSRFNALKDGSCALEPFLPWENPTDYQKLRARVFKASRATTEAQELIVESMVECYWLERRVRNTTALATYRHAFGEALEQAGAKTWRQAVSLLRTHNLNQEDNLKVMAKSECELAQAASQWSNRADATSELTEFAEKVIKILRKHGQMLSQMLTGLDAQREFFLEYSPKHLERRIRLENSIHAQLRRLRADLVIEQEAELMREKSRKTGEGTDEQPDNSPGPRDNSPGPRDNIDKAGAPVNEPEPTCNDACVDPDADDLLRDDTVDDWDNDSDPLGEFVRENAK